MVFSGIEKTSLVDFDGIICATVFTNGCNFRCPFCHNSSLVIGQPDEKISEDYVLSYLNKRKGIIEGLCITGGEPTLHDGIVDFYKKVKDLGLKTKLDTNGTNPEMLELLINERLVDYVAMDVKSSLDEYYKFANATDKMLESINKSINILLRGEIDYEFRTTLVNGFQSYGSIEKMAKLIKGAKKLYLQKFEDKGNCLEQGLSEIDYVMAKKYKDILSQSVISVKLRGYEIY